MTRTRELYYFLIGAYLWDDGLRLGILRALCRVAEVAPEAVEEVRDRLQEIVSTENPEERACLARLFAGKREEVDGT